MTTIDALIRGFARLLAASWPEITSAAKDTTTGSYVQDWQQANWEMFVEGALPGGGVFLEVYGEGADCNDGSSRVYRPAARATHAVVCRERVGALQPVDLLSKRRVAIGGMGYRIEEFATMSESWYVVSAPFDCVVVQTPGGPSVFSLDDIAFDLSAISNGE